MRRVMKLGMLLLMVVITQCFRKGNIRMNMNVRHRQKNRKSKKYTVTSQYGMDALKINNQNLVGNSGERRENYYGSVNLDPKVFKSMMGEGITSDYGQMLMDPSRYLISQGLKKTKNDIKNDVLLGIKPDPARAKGLKYSYGELDDTENDDQAVFTHSYDEMLTNPKKKVLVLGVHPELATNNTRQLATEMEDPEIVETEEDFQEKQNRQKEVEQKVQKVKSFLDLIQNEFKSGQVVNDRQKQILEQLNQYLQSDDEQIPLYSEFKDQVNSFVNQQLKGANCKENKNDDNKSRFKKNDGSQIGQIGTRALQIQKELEAPVQQGVLMQSPIANKMALKGIQPSRNMKMPNDITQLSDDDMQSYIQSKIDEHAQRNGLIRQEKDDVDQQKQKDKIINQIQSLYTDLKKSNNNNEIIGQDIFKNIKNVDPSQIRKLIASIDSIGSTQSSPSQNTENKNLISRQLQKKYVMNQEQQQQQQQMDSKKYLVSQEQQPDSNQDNQNEQISQEDLQQQIDSLQVKIKDNLIHIQDINLPKNYNNKTANLVNSLMNENQQFLNLQQQLLKQKQMNQYYYQVKQDQEQQIKQQDQVEKNLAINNTKKLSKKIQLRGDQANSKIQIQDLKNMIAKLEASNRRKIKLRKRR